MGDKRIASLYDYARVCKNYIGANNTYFCFKCPLSEENNNTKENCAAFVINNIDKANEIIIRWCNEHPIKTRLSELLKLFPNVDINGDNIVFCPNGFEKNYRNHDDCLDMDCFECKKEYWTEEIE